MALVAGLAEHEDTFVGPLTTGSAGQVVVVYPLAEVGPVAVHEATATLLVLLVAQVVVTQLLPEAAAEPVHEATGTLLVVLTLQVVVVQLLPAAPVAGVQEEALIGVGPAITRDRKSVV